MTKSTQVPLSTSREMVSPPLQHFNPPQPDIPKHERSKLLVPVLVVVILAIFGLAGYFGHQAVVGYQGGKQMAVVQREMRQALRLVSYAPGAGDRIDMKISATGKFANLESYAKEQISGYAKAQEAYNKAVDNAIESLNGKSLAADTGKLSRHKQVLADTRKESEAYYRAAVSYFSLEAWRAQAAKLPITQAQEDGFVNAFDEWLPGFSKRLPKIKEAQSIDEKLWDQYETLIDFLVKNDEEWSVNKNGQLVFTNQETLAEFRDQAEKLQEHGSKLNRLLM